MKLINFNLKSLPRRKRGKMSEEHRTKISQTRQQTKYGGIKIDVFGEN